MARFSGSENTQGESKTATDGTVRITAFLTNAAELPRCGMQTLAENVVSEAVGGGSGIRTHGELAPTPVFKTGALNRSAIPPTI